MPHHQKNSKQKTKKKKKNNAATTNKKRLPQKKEFSFFLFIVLFRPFALHELIHSTEWIRIGVLHSIHMQYNTDTKRKSASKMGEQKQKQNRNTKRNAPSSRSVGENFEAGFEQMGAAVQQASQVHAQGHPGFGRHEDRRKHFTMATLDCPVGGAQEKVLKKKKKERKIWWRILALRLVFISWTELLL